MSIASEIARLQGIKSDIQDALVDKGIPSASTHDMEDFATDIEDIPTGEKLPDASVRVRLSGSDIVFDENGDPVITEQQDYELSVNMFIFMYDDSNYEYILDRYIETEE